MIPFLKVLQACFAIFFLNLNLKNNPWIYVVIEIYLRVNCDAAQESNEIIIHTANYFYVIFKIVLASLSSSRNPGLPNNNIFKKLYFILYDLFEQKRLSTYLYTQSRVE